MGFEPTNRGFAGPRLSPLGYGAYFDSFYESRRRPRPVNFAGRLSRAAPAAHIIARLCWSASQRLSDKPIRGVNAFAVLPSPVR